MKLIGVTGGVGAGKSQVLGYIRDTYKARILLADEAANDLKKPGMPCYEPVIATLGRQILREDGTINNKKMAEAIFASPEKLAQINAIIHPVVSQDFQQWVHPSGGAYLYYAADPAGKRKRSQ